MTANTYMTHIDPYFLLFILLLLLAAAACAYDTNKKQ